MSIYEELTDEQGNVIATFSTMIGTEDIPNVIVSGGQGRLVGYDDDGYPVVEDANEDAINAHRLDFTKRIMKMHELLRAQ